MNATKCVSLGLCGLVLSSWVSLAHAAGNLNASSQSKVSNAMAKKWSAQDTSKDGYQAQQDKTFVNIGNKRAGNCNVNIGTVQKGQKAPKEIVVTTKEVINVCK
jgi:hypothetical protein